MEENNTIEQKSTILTDEQVTNVADGKEINDGLNDNIQLPSEENVIPEKYAGKSAEEVYRLMKVEQEYKEGITPEVKDETTIENNEVVIEENVVKEYTEKLLENGGEFTEQDYKELAEKGYTKDVVDNYRAGVEAKQLTEINETFVAANTTKEDFVEAGKWARDNWDESRVNEFNEAMNEAVSINNVTIQKSLIRSLTESYTNAPKQVETFHTNTQPKQNIVDGYSIRSDYFKDVNDIRYKKDPSFRSLVESKFLKTDRGNW